MLPKTNSSYRVVTREWAMQTDSFFAYRQRNEDSEMQ